MKILLADQRKDNLNKLGKLISGLGHEVLIAAGGREAWRTWNHEHPCMVIMDATLTDMSGLDFCSAIRDLEGDDYTYIILIASTPSEVDVVRALDAGADDYVCIPFNIEELTARIRAGERIVVRNNQDLSLLTMAKLAEFHNPDIGRHIKQVREYSRILAEIIASRPDAPLGMNHSFLDQIYLASALHDLGNAGIPDHILSKPDILTAEEFAIVTNHTIIGFNSVCEALKHQPNALYLKMAADIALSHHEQYSGEGYPHGLKGESIPFSARIVALADVYDALVNDRPYRPAYTHDVAVDIILNGCGQHFDPLVVSAFEANHHRFERIHHADSTKDYVYDRQLAPTQPFIVDCDFSSYKASSKGILQMDEIALSIHAEGLLANNRHH